MIRTPIRAPNANAYAERVIETIRAECLDWTLVLGRRHLDQTIRTYAEHYNSRRPHRALSLATPIAAARDPVPIHPGKASSLLISFPQSNAFDGRLAALNT